MWSLACTLASPPLGPITCLVSMNEEQGSYWEQFLQAWREDVYLRLSIYGMVLFAALCVINVLCWLRYGATISAMFDSKSGWSLIICVTTYHK